MRRRALVFGAGVLLIVCVWLLGATAARYAAFCEDLGRAWAQLSIPSRLFIRAGNWSQRLFPPILYLVPLVCLGMARMWRTLGGVLAVIGMLFLTGAIGIVVGRAGGVIERHYPWIGSSVFALVAATIHLAPGLALLKHGKRSRRTN